MKSRARKGFAALVLIAVSQVAHADWEPIPIPVQVAAFNGVIADEDDPPIICLRVNGKDPSQSVLDSLKTERLVVVASECKMAASVWERSSHLASGDPAVFYSLFGLRMHSEDLLQLTFSTYVNGRQGSSEILTMSRVDDAWSVVNREGQWVSMVSPSPRAR